MKDNIDTLQDLCLAWNRRFLLESSVPGMTMVAEGCLTLKVSLWLCVAQGQPLWRLPDDEGRT